MSDDDESRLAPAALAPLPASFFLSLSSFVKERTNPRLTAPVSLSRDPFIVYSASLIHPLLLTPFHCMSTCLLVVAVLSRHTDRQKEEERGRERQGRREASCSFTRTHTLSCLVCLALNRRVVSCCLPDDSSSNSSCEIRLASLICLFGWRERERR